MNKEEYFIKVEGPQLIYATIRKIIGNKQFTSYCGEKKEDREKIKIKLTQDLILEAQKRNDDIIVI